MNSVARLQKSQHMIAPSRRDISAHTVHCSAVAIRCRRLRDIGRACLRSIGGADRVRASPPSVRAVCMRMGAHRVQCRLMGMIGVRCASRLLFFSLFSLVCQSLRSIPSPINANVVASMCAASSCCDCCCYLRPICGIRWIFCECVPLLLFCDERK